MYVIGSHVGYFQQGLYVVDRSTTYIVVVEVLRSTVGRYLLRT